MAERWSDINRIDERILANRNGAQKVDDEIEHLKTKREKIEAEYEELSQKRKYIGKEVYGDPEVRKNLIQSGKKSSSVSVRQAADKLEKEETYQKWDEAYREELIDIYVIIDQDSSKIKNWNISHLFEKIGKVLYSETENY